MNLNADFSIRAAVHSATLEWVASPLAGVSRRMLDRIGGEVARATSIVRYDPGSHFSPHTHTGGEEFVVLSGVFQDEHGDFPEGSYIRNPPQSRHTPRSDEGCVIFVKLWQFDLADRTHVRTKIDQITPTSTIARPGVTVIPLFEDPRETVSVEHWEPGTQVTLDAVGGTEILVLDGHFEQGAERFDQYSWLRIPSSEKGLATAGSTGAKVWIKTGHLRLQSTLYNTPPHPTA